VVDRELVEQAQRGDRAAFERLALAASDGLYAIATGILRDRDAAADALQVALVRIWRDLPTLRDAGRFDAWSRRVLVNRCYQLLRTTRRWPAPVPIAPADALVGDSERAFGARDELERAFVRLTPEQRAVVVLHYYEDMPQDAIAGALGISVGTVKSRLHHARRALRAAIEADARPVEEGGRVA
jgi:RNA polymerase sigma-70 factor (ECF subfamily)